VYLSSSRKHSIPCEPAPGACLDYYTRTVFEWVTTILARKARCVPRAVTTVWSSSSVASPTPAAGFALGLERLAELAALQQVAGADRPPQVYVAPLGEGKSLSKGWRWPNCCAMPAYGSSWHCGGGFAQVATQARRPQRGTYALLLGESELATAQVSVKSLRADEPQQLVR